MRIVTIIVLALIAGLIFGLALVELRLGIWPWSGTVGDSPGRYMLEGLPAPDPTVGIPKVEIAKTEHDFGVMDADAEGHYAFKFTNAGTAPLSLVAGSTSCKCTVSEIEKEELAPGESTEVIVRWEPNSYFGPYKQTAVILTNDQMYPQVTLVVQGRISASLLCVPEELKFSNPLPAGKPTVGEVSILDFLEQPMEITGSKFSDRETADFFQAEFIPMTEDQLAEYSDCQSGVIARITVLPGLPRGAFRQQLLIATGVEDAPALVLPIMGIVGDDISILGKGWNQQSGVLTLGRVVSSEGISRTIYIITRGVDEDSVILRLKNVTPDILKVEIGETEPFGDTGRITRTRMTIEIPAGTRTISYIGGFASELASIDLETGLSDSPMLHILLNFFVEE